jgi:hypothetical protein
VDALRSGPDRSPVVRFAPDRRYTAAAVGGMLLAALIAAFTSDSAGRFLFVVAAVVLAAYVATDLIFSPRISASVQGVVLNAPFARAHLDWSQIESISADSRSRYGVRSTVLEVDAGSMLALFSRRAIGTDPESAATLLLSLDPRWSAPGPGRSEGGGGHADDGDDQDRYPR